MRFSVYQVSRRGGREKNEDRMGYSYTRDAGLFALADGMGGHPEGEVAAQLALQSLSNLFQRNAKPGLDDPAHFLQEGVLAGHLQLLAYAASKGMSDTPRTTLVACVLQGNQAYWAHCGDSRLYLVRGDKLIARTRDHSYLELQAALGRGPMSIESFNRNVLFTCLGSPGKPMVDLSGPLTLQDRDRLLLCSDGLWGTVGDDVITAQLSERSIEEAVLELVEQALRNGGPRCDNVTALAVEWEASGSKSAQSIATRSLGSDEFSTTIQAALDDQAPGIDLDDAEIESSVREIKDAINKRSSKKTT